MAHTISYSDFLKEGALHESKPATEEVAVQVKPFHIPPQDVPTETELKAYWKKLRHFFRTGERPEGKNGILVPALIAPYLRSGSWETEYPFYLAPGNETGLPLEELINDELSKLFKEGEAKILRKNSKRLIVLFRGKMDMDNASIPFAEAKEYAFEKLSHLDVHDEEGERFRGDMQKLKDALPNDGVLVDFSHEVPLFIIRQNLERIEANRQAYKKLMQKKAEELRELLKLDEEKDGGTADAEKGFEFAHDMIALDKVREMVPKKGSSKMDASRVQRINGLIKLLDDTLNSQENRAHLIVNNELEADFRWKDIFASSKVSFTGLHDAFKRVEQIFDSNIGSFTNVIVAMRKADLELEGKYDTEVHEEYFSHFKWFKLSAEELALFPPVILATGGTHLLRDGMADFSNLLVSNKPIKVLALTNRTTNEINPDIDWEDASHSFRQELAAIALSHRGAHTLQCAADKPGCLRRGIAAAINTSFPALMHLLVPARSEDARVSFLKINAAAAGRFFPYLAYNCDQGAEWGSRFDISSNSQPEKDWAVFDFSYQAEDEQQVNVELPFTYADYKAMNLEKVEELMLVPEGMRTDFLVPIHEYLALSPTEVTGKVPYIWLMGEDNAMIRAAVPYMWAQSCQERLDFWNFIQELGGVNSYHVKLALAREKAKWEKEKADEIAALKAEQKKEIDQVKQTAAGEAMERLTNILLGNEVISAPAAPKPVAAKPAPAAKPAEKPADKPAPAKAEPAKPAAAPAVEAMDPYVDTFKCTSCNDCTEKFPAIFMYNEDKQAEVKPDWKGTFENLVMAAEGCPASCIHPGDPKNPKEANLEELKKRAAKFN